MVAVVVSASAIISNALEGELLSHFSAVKKMSHIEFVEIETEDVEAILFDMTNAETDVEILLSFAARASGLASKVAILTRDSIQLRQLVPLAGRVAAILPHSCSIGEIAAVARLVRTGLSIVPTDMMPLIAQGAAEAQYSSISGSFSLTHREKVVLGLVAMGDSNKLIARKLSINDTTVRVHVRSLLQKLKVKNRTQAALFVVNQRQDKPS